MAVYKDKRKESVIDRIVSFYYNIP